MRKFFVTMAYDLSPDTTPEARKLLRAELVGRRWHDRVRDRLMPRCCVWIDRQVDDDQTTGDVHTLSATELRDAVRKVAATGRPIQVLRAWIQVAGGGTYGLTADGFFDSHGGATTTDKS